MVRKNPEITSPPATLPAATPEMLERRRKILDETFGLWAGEEGERIEKELNEIFKRPEPFETWDDPA